MINHRSFFYSWHRTFMILVWSSVEQLNIMICKCQDNENKIECDESLYRLRCDNRCPTPSPIHTMIWEILITLQPWQTAPGLSSSWAHQKRYLFPGTYALLTSSCFFLMNSLGHLFLFLNTSSNEIIFMVLNFQRNLPTQIGAMMKYCLSLLSCGQQTVALNQTI